MNTQECQRSGPVLGVLSVLLPPVAVAVLHGRVFHRKVAISLLLTICFWVPGIIYSLIVCMVDYPERNHGRDGSSAHVSEDEVYHLPQPKPTYPTATNIFKYPTALMSIIIRTPGDAALVNTADHFNENNPINPFSATRTIV